MFLKKKLKNIILTFLLSFCTVSWAVIKIGIDPTVSSGASSDFELTISPNDNPNPDNTKKVYSNQKAYTIVTFLFGTMDDSTASSPGQAFYPIICSGDYCSTLMPNLFAIFNSGILSIAIFFLSYVVVVGSFVQANDGSALSEKFSSSIIPLRSAFGLGLIMPTRTGYSLIQTIVIKIALFGSSAGTIVWHYLLDYYYMTGKNIGTLSSNTYSSDPTSFYNIAQKVISNMNEISVCNAYMNYTDTTGHFVGLSTARITQVPQYFFSSYWDTDSENNSILNTGYIDGNSTPIGNTDGFHTGSNLGTCASIKFSLTQPYQNAIGTEVYSLPSDLKNLLLSYLNEVSGTAQHVVDSYAISLTNTLDPATTQNYVDQYTILANALQTDLQSYFYKLNPPAVEQTTENTEWLDLPQYFYTKLMVSSSPGVSNSLSIGIAPVTGTMIPRNIDNTGAAITASNTDFINLNSVKNSTCNFSQMDNQAQQNSLNFTFSSTAASKTFNDQIQKMFNQVGTSEDPIIGLSKIGMEWFNTAQDIMIAAMSVSLIISTLTGIAADFISVETLGLVTNVMGVIVAMFQAIGLIIPIATIFAVGLPLTPLMIYTAAIVNWISYLVVAVTGAPFIAMGLMSTGPGLGKADPALLILLNLFLRPSLYVVGLVAGAKLFNIGYVFFTQGFLSTANDIFVLFNVDDTALMSIVSIMFLYAYTFAIAAVCTRSYSMILLLPDRVLTWIGAPALQSPELQLAIRTVSSTVNQAGQAARNAGDTLLRGANTIFDEQVRTARQKIKGIDKGVKDGTIVRDEFTARNIAKKLDNAIAPITGAMGSINSSLGGGKPSEKGAFESVVDRASSLQKTLKSGASATVVSTQKGIVDSARAVDTMFGGRLSKAASDSSASVAKAREGIVGYAKAVDANSGGFFSAAAGGTVAIVALAARAPQSIYNSIKSPYDPKTGKYGLTSEEIFLGTVGQVGFNQAFVSTYLTSASAYTGYLTKQRAVVMSKDSNSTRALAMLKIAGVGTVGALGLFVGAVGGLVGAMVGMPYSASKYTMKVAAVVDTEIAERIAAKTTYESTVLRYGAALAKTFGYVLLAGTRLAVGVATMGVGIAVYPVSSTVFDTGSSIAGNALRKGVFKGTFAESCKATQETYSAIAKQKLEKSKENPSIGNRAYFSNLAQYVAYSTVSGVAKVAKSASYGAESLRNISFTNPFKSGTAGLYAMPGEIELQYNEQQKTLDKERSDTLQIISYSGIARSSYKNIVKQPYAAAKDASTEKKYLSSLGWALGAGAGFIVHAAFSLPIATIVGVGRFTVVNSVNTIGFVAAGFGTTLAAAAGSKRGVEVGSSYVARSLLMMNQSGFSNKSFGYNEASVGYKYAGAASTLSGQLVGGTVNAGIYGSMAGAWALTKLGSGVKSVITEAFTFEYTQRAGAWLLGRSKGMLNAHYSAKPDEPVLNGIKALGYGVNKVAAIFIGGAGGALSGVGYLSQGLGVGGLAKMVAAGVDNFDQNYSTGSVEAFKTLEKWSPKKELLSSFLDYAVKAPIDFAVAATVTPTAMIFGMVHGYSEVPKGDGPSVAIGAGDLLKRAQGSS